MWTILCWVAMAVFAVFGVACAMWLLADTLCGSCVCLAVRVPDAAAREQLDLLLAEAGATLGAHRDILVLFSQEQPPLTAQEAALLQRYGAKLCTVVCPATHGG